jgi:hypothetical protein
MLLAVRLRHLRFGTYNILTASFLLHRVYKYFIEQASLLCAPELVSKDLVKLFGLT